MTNKVILEGLGAILTTEQINTNTAVLYDATADRYKKYAKAKKTLDNPLPLAIVYPSSSEQVAEVLKFCNKHKINVIPRSGNTSTEGGLENWKAQSIVVDAKNLNKIIKLDTYNMQATVQAGVPLQLLDDELRKLGFTTGHSPQSKPVAQLGGLVATRSIGQFSTLYGGIEDMVVGIECVFADGTISRIKNTTRRASGPDIRHIIIGNEGALCYITEVTVKIFRYYPDQLYFGWLLKDVDTGIKVLREVMVNGFRPSVARVYDAGDAAQHFSSFNKGYGLLIFSAEGAPSIVKATGEAIEQAVEKFKSGIVEKADPDSIEKWFNRLNWSQATIDREVSDMLKDNKHDGYTTEVSADWETIPVLYHNVLDRIKKECKDFEFTLLGAHSSHSYINGTNMYFVYNYKIDCEPNQEFAKYHHPLQTIIVEETLKLNGSICHHHGCGKYRTEWIKEEHGSAWHLLEKLKSTLDPNGIMSYGTLYPQKDTDKFFQ